jgi:hypothetical protein
MRETQANASRRDDAIAEAVTILLDHHTPVSKAALVNNLARRQAKAFASMWNDPDFKLDMRSPEHGPWKFIADVLRTFMETGAIEGKPASNNYKMSPALKNALQERLGAE